MSGIESVEDVDGFECDAALRVGSCFKDAFVILADCEECEQRLGE